MRAENRFPLFLIPLYPLVATPAGWPQAKIRTLARRGVRRSKIHDGLAST
jgi:hypothetical protein